MSDGVSRLVTEYEMATWDEIFATLRTAGPRGLIETVRKTEATDPTGRRWPRYGMTRPWPTGRGDQHELSPREYANAYANSGAQPRPDTTPRALRF